MAVNRFTHAVDDLKLPARYEQFRLQTEPQSFELFSDLEDPFGQGQSADKSALSGLDDFGIKFSLRDNPIIDAESI